jgi:hypothetical protein
LRNIRRYPRPALLAALVLTGLLLAGGSLATAVGGLLNPGFESGILNGNPANWTVMSRADSVRVVDAETPAEYQTYGQMGNVTVTPHRGDLQLRLGTPRPDAETGVPALLLGTPREGPLPHRCERRRQVCWGPGGARADQEA